MPHGSNRSAVTVTPEPTGFPNFKVKAPVNLSRSKIKDPRMGKAKSTYSRKQERRPSKHNLALKNLRFVKDSLHGSLNSQTALAETHKTEQETEKLI